MIAFNRRILYQYIRRIAVDLLLTPLAFYLALLIQLDGQLTAQKLEAMSHAVLPITFVYIAINLFFGIYRRIWVYASFRDVILLSETIGLGTLMLVVINVYVLPRYYYGLPTGSLVIGGLLFLILSTMVRYRRQLMAILFASRSQSTGSRRERVLIVGVNETAQQLATQIFLGNRKLNYELVGFVDDDLDDHGMTVNGVEILGAPEHVPKLVHDSQIDVIIIARQLSDREEMWQLISTCQETAAQVKVLPDMAQVIESGYKDPLTLRDVSIDDLLGRAPANTCVESCRHILADKVVVVTGAAGSIGSELCRQILRFKPQSLLALDNNETGLHELNLELNQNGQSPLHLIMGDVLDGYKMDRVFHQYRPQVVFHAAAYKHVPLVEEHPDEALRVNVLGTVIVSEMAHQYKAERFVFISTDKAVNPSSVMGASKRIGELWVRSLKECSDTIFTTVRFGNVIGSRGSVVPTFARQIELGGPVTVTHPEMTRFFMSIPEAVSLVLQSATFNPSGGIFMLEMGEEISVLNVAQRMIRLKGLRVHKDIEIEFTGIRPGEKLHEELVCSLEFARETPHPSIYRLQSPNSSIDREILLGVISILTDSRHITKAAQRVRDEIFQIASCDIDGFLNKVAGLDLMRDWRQLTDSDDVRTHTEENVACPIGKRIAESALSVPS
jgi:FlaA1/EpsC-like NDP-sugar epimerase